jgi:hypothetical protein
VRHESHVFGDCAVVIHRTVIGCVDNAFRSLQPQVTSSHKTR